MFSEFFKRVFLGEEEIFSRKTIFLHLALILLSFVFVYLYSTSTSFRYPFFGGDSAVFQLVGKSWLECAIPYKDLFDHKGPLIYLIDAVGYTIYPRSGIMIPQIIFMYVALLFIWRILGLYFNSAKKILFFVLTVIYFRYCYWEGNHVDEYSISFLAAATYCFASCLKYSRIERLYGLIYGFGFGASVLLRTTNSMPICCFVFLSTILLIQARDFKALRENFLTFCAGFAIIVLPFVIYFAAHDALYDMLYGTILFNIKYAVNGSFHNETTYYLFFCAITFFPLIVMLVASVFELIINRKNKFAWCTLFSGTMLLVMLLKLRSYSHYSMILVLVLPLMFVVLNDALKNFWQGLKKIWRPREFSLKRLACKAFLMIFVPLSLYYTGFCFNIYLKGFSAPFSEEMLEEEEKFLKASLQVDELKKIIPDDEKNSLVTWGISVSVSSWLLMADIKPRCRFFYNQSHFFSIDPVVSQEWFQDVTKDYPLWILYGGKSVVESNIIFTSPEDEGLEQLLAEKYLYKGEADLDFQTLKLYRLKE